MKEVWKDIAGYEGLYQVSNFGRVRSLERVVQHMHSGKLTLPSKLKEPSFDGRYLFVVLSKDGKRKQFSIHRLVAETFIPNPDGLPCVNHKDENKTNNHVDNLEWCTYKYNTHYGTNIERARKKKGKAVNQYDLHGNLVNSWESLAEAERAAGYDHRRTSRAALGQRKTAYGYIWRYKEAK